MSTETGQIERALGALLTAMLAEEDRRPETSSISVPSRPETEVAQLAWDPVYFALRLAVRRLGERLHAIADGTVGMRYTAYRVANFHPARGAPILCMLESAWDGIGTDRDRWAA